MKLDFRKPIRIVKIGAISMQIAHLAERMQSLKLKNAATEEVRQTNNEIMREIRSEMEMYEALLELAPLMATFVERVAGDMSVPACVREVHFSRTEVHTAQNVIGLLVKRCQQS